MKQRLVRCYRGFAELLGRSNIEVFYSLPDTGYWNKLFTCIGCGEVFVADFENPAFAGKTDRQIAGEIACPGCEMPLQETMRPYPQTFRTIDGQIGHFVPGRMYPRDSESVVKEILELGT